MHAQQKRYEGGLEMKDTGAAQSVWFVLASNEMVKRQIFDAEKNRARLRFNLGQAR
jgi:hypothetical protein